MGVGKVGSQESVSISPEKSITVSQKRNTRQELISCQKRNAQKKPCDCKKLYVSKL
jgi:hypothetical protein